MFRPLLKTPFATWFVAAILLLSSSAIFAVQHAYINHNRSSIYNYVFISQSLSAEYGSIASNGGSEVEVGKDANWKGMGIKTAAGIEVLKFVQFEVGHTFLNLKNHNNSFETLGGSRINLGTKLVFRSPLVNLEGGVGLLASRLDYQKELSNADFYGNGHYYTLGLSYYLHSKISMHLYGNMNREHLVRNAGAQDVKEIDTDTTSGGIGFTVWL